VAQVNERAVKLSGRQTPPARKLLINTHSNTPSVRSVIQTLAAVGLLTREKKNQNLLTNPHDWQW
jgi:hypothetical protein